MKFTNKHDVPLPLAVWLLHDDYDYVDDPDYISATSLMKPTRQIVLSSRVTKSLTSLDISDLISATLGKSIHSAIESAWMAGAYKKLSMLEGITEDDIKSIVINPEPDELKDDSVPIYLEQRTIKQFGKWKIGGKFDLVADGILHDYKSTTVYTWIYDNKVDDYVIQGSLYKWANPEKITANYIRICFIFTDWQSANAKRDPTYPQNRVAYADYPLMSKEDTEAWIQSRLDAIEQNQDKEQEDMVECTEEELWYPTPKFKYYSNPAKTDGRATRVFGTLAEAQEFKTSKGEVGIIIIEQGQPKRCLYCPAYDICEQRKRYYND